MKWLRLLALALFFPQLLSATANVSGKLAAPDTTGVPSGSVARLDLRNCGGNYPVVSGASITTRQEYTLAADGTWSGVLYRNDEISCNGSFTTFWTLTYFVRNVQAGPSRDYLCSQASCNFDSMTPITVYPPPTPPAQPLTGAQSVACSFTAASTWTCLNTLNTASVIVDIYDLSGHELVKGVGSGPTEVTTVVNSVTATFASPTSGSMYVVNAGNWTPSSLVPNYLISNPTSDQSISGDHALAVGGSFSAKRIGTIRVVDAANTANWAGTDATSWIASAIADIPAPGGVIYLFAKPDGTCYNSPTPLVISTLGKYVSIKGIGAGGSSGAGGTFGGPCLFDSNTGAHTYITIDNAPFTGSPQSTFHIIENVQIVNASINGGSSPCQLVGGCGNLSVGIDSGDGTRSQGTYEGSFQDVSMVGFGTCFRNANSLSVQSPWYNPQFHYCTTDIALGTSTGAGGQQITGLILYGGQYAGQGTVVKSLTNAAPEVKFVNPTVFNGGTLFADFTGGSGGFLSLDDPHIEGGNSSRQITGNMDVWIHGGSIGYDFNTGLHDWVINSTGNIVKIDGGTKFGTPGGACPANCVDEVVLAGANTRVDYDLYNSSPGHFHTSGSADVMVSGSSKFSGNQILPGAQAEIPRFFLDLEIGTGAGWIVDGGGLPPGQLTKYVCGSNSASAYELFCSANNDTFSKVPRVGVANTFTAVQTYTQQITSTLATGTAPLAVSSTTENTNLNSQLWHSRQAIEFSAAIDFASISAQTCTENTITATGAVTGNRVFPGWPSTLENGLSGLMYVSAADTVKVRLCNVTVGAIDPASQTFAGSVVK